MGCEDATVRLGALNGQTTIDLICNEGSLKGKTIQGICEVKNNLSLCVAKLGSKRPTNYVTDDSDNIAMILIRLKDQPKDEGKTTEEAKKAELAALQGTWKQVRWEENGKVMPVDPKTTWVVKGDQVVTGNGHRGTLEIVDLTKTPPQLNVRLEGRKVDEYIFIRKGNELMMCGNRGGPRPTEFKSIPRKEELSLLFVWKIEGPSSSGKTDPGAGGSDESTLPPLLKARTGVAKTAKTIDEAAKGYVEVLREIVAQFARIKNKEDALAIKPRLKELVKEMQDYGKRFADLGAKKLDPKLEEEVGKLSQQLADYSKRLNEIPGVSEVLKDVK